MELFSASLELSLSQIKRELFKIPKRNFGYSNFSKEEWKCMRSLANDRRIIIKKADKGSCVVVWDCESYIAVSEKQSSDKNMYRDVNFRGKTLQDLAETSNDIFRNLKRKGKLTEKKKLNTFFLSHKKTK